MLLSPVPLKKVQFYSENFRGQKEIKKQKQDINNMQNCSIATKKKKKKEGKEKKKERKKRVNPSAKTDLCI
jgi:hypothetical protein